jgi:vanillate O-demethylase ferredoxin subunit
MTLTALKAPLAESAWIDVVVASKSPEAPLICSHELVDAGAHILVEVRTGMSRSYSLNDLHKVTDGYRIAVLPDSASLDGSVAVHNDLQAGQLTRVSLPRNHFSKHLENSCLLAMLGTWPLGPMN